MRGNKEEFRKAGGPFGLLKADFNLWWSSWKRLRQAKKHYKNLLKKGLITEKTYREILSGKLTDDTHVRDRELMDKVGMHFHSYAHEYAEAPKNISFGGFNFKGGEDFAKEAYQFEGSISAYADNKYYITLSAGTLIHFESLSILYGSVGGFVPPLSTLARYQDQIIETFSKNLSWDERDIMERMALPEQVYFIEPQDTLWQAELAQVQGFLAQDFNKALKIFLIGHEFGHFVHRLSSDRPDAQWRAEAFLQRREITGNDAWLEEFSCDVIGLQFAIRFLKETKHHQTSRGLFKSGLLNTHNPISFLLGRGKKLEHLLNMEDNMIASGKTYDMDVHVLMIAAVKILFWNLAKINDDPCQSHPPPSLRLEFLLEDLRAADLPDLMLNLTETLDWLRDSVDTGVPDEMLHHPFANKMTAQR